jgi:polyvinyl alcohol dehydrogenase (cytochrome)
MIVSKRIVLCGISSLLWVAGGAQAQNRDGATVFQQICSMCHRENSPTQAPLPDVLRKMPVQAIVTALETGKMAAIGANLSASERTAVAGYLGVAGVESIPQSAHCSSNVPLAKNAPSWNGWGIDLTNTRYQNAKAAGLTPADVPKLKLKWAFGYPGVTTSFGTPTVYGGRIFVGAADGTVFSLDAHSGCIYWTYKATEGVRTGPVISADGKTAYLSDLHAWVHAVNAETGALLWKVHVDEGAEASIAGTPKLDGARLYMGSFGG